MYLSELSGFILNKDLGEYVRSGRGLERLPRQYRFYRSEALSNMIEGGAPGAHSERRVSDY